MLRLHVCNSRCGYSSLGYTTCGNSNESFGTGRFEMDHSFFVFGVSRLKDTFEDILF